tara:strand:+ start:764 stop:1222 length:459 start_codon:yes stop_codon:yes gene_type:complete
MREPITAAAAGYAVKAALRRAVKVLGGGAALSQDLEISESYLSKLQGPHYPEMLRADTALVIDSMVGAPLILDAQARLLGYVLVKGSATDAGQPDLTDLLRLVGSSSDLSQTLGKALEDNIVDANESRTMHLKIENMVRCLRDLQGKLDGGR